MKDIDSPAAASEYIGVPVGTLAQWRYLKTGPRFIRAGRMIRYRKADLDAWLDAHAVSTKDQPASAPAG